MGSTGGYRGGRGPAERGAIAILTTIVGAVFICTPSTAIAAASPSARSFSAASPPAAATSNEVEAMAAIAQYEEAFVEGDCELFVQATTPAFRQGLGIADCQNFAERARGRAEVIETVELTPVSAVGMGRGFMAAVVHAQTSSNLDADGQPVTTPVLLDSDYRYHLVRSDGVWKIAAVHDVTGGRTEGRLTEEEEDAVAVMMTDWRAAYSTGDCDALQTSTTAGFREAMAWTDCAAFQQFVADQNAYCPMDVHQEDIRFWDNVDPHVGEIMLDVVQVCTLEIDEFGNPIEPPYQAGAPYRYHLVGAGNSWQIAEDDNGAAAEDEPGNTNEVAAVEAIHGYNQAWLDVDCDLYLETTTEGLRNALDVAGCASFGPSAREYNKSVANFALTVTDIERPSPTRMAIKSHETYDSLTDVDGQPVETPFLIDEYWVYTVDLVKGTWVISDIVMLL